MKKVFKIVLSFVICLLFSSMSYASPNGVARELARIAKQQIQKQYGKFPIKINDKTSLANITADGQYIIYDYLYKNSSQKFTSEILALYVQMMFDKRTYESNDFVSLFQNVPLEELVVSIYTKLDEIISCESFSEERVCETIVDELLLLFNMLYQQIDSLIEGLLFFIDEGLVNKYFQFIRADKYYFDCDKIICSDLFTPFCVKPKQNNPRIINQKGAFIIFGFDHETLKKMSPPKEHFSFRPKDKNDNEVKIVISGDKATMLKDLETLAINDATMFPEIDNISGYITNKYLNK
ncbi:hypothetical protein [Gilliamella sp. ESL0250]|uniref:hypothetical protein n=1 Tax=Gilliamella sp. ESL0250 TaxID=2705036 RepID=UPI00157FCD07|nr:hypothetical protein [Gilliamella sp. ESL0250]NUF49598.1 hypothetical protein [Gilliamella sp. ESL0250]